MILMLVLPNDELLSIEVEDRSTVGSLIEVAAGLSDCERVELYLGQIALTDPLKTLSAYGVAPNDLIRVRSAPPAPQQELDQPDRIRNLAERIRAEMAGTPVAPQQPPVDPLSAAGQEAILKMVQMTNIERNRQEAASVIPESFVQVTMLWVNVKVNGVELQAFVDCGAQHTMISRKIAERCNLSHLIDARYSGLARGVGEAKICGRIHRALMEAGGCEFDASFIVLENSPFLFGLDLLYRHRCCIDLKTRSLRIADIVELPFLNANEIESEEH